MTLVVNSDYTVHSVVVVEIPDSAADTVDMVAEHFAANMAAGIADTGFDYYSVADIAVADIPDVVVVD